ncbi:MAG: ABC transporter substrate-binding protein [Candidatus Binatia bacterium]|nr:ABC transporter substrate-binding protein [bacterium]MDZ4343449.1 ABC transporter substrate-binding protein [Candidatus Binatia bacterium]
MAPIWVAQEAELFTKHGLDVQLNYLAATTAVQAMVGETEDVGLVGNQGIDANLEGANLVYVATGTPTFVFHLYGDPRIQSVADLKGKVGIGVRLQIMILLKKSGSNNQGKIFRSQKLCNARSELS